MEALLYRSLPVREPERPALSSDMGLQPDARHSSTLSSMFTAPACCSVSRALSTSASSSTSTFTTAPPRRTASA